MIALASLAPDVAEVPEVQVQALAIDSRAVTPGALFIALAGLEADGHDYIDAAIANGAAAVFSQREVSHCSVPLVVLGDLASRVSQIAGEFFGHPSQSMRCIAVTGTNGKTSVAHFAAQLANELGISAGFLGTTGWGLVGKASTLAPAALTTADAVSLQERLATLKQQGCELVALELSSHALQQHRGDALDVDVALFTNLTRDHLDYHGDMEAYGAAKARLFDFPSLTGMVINADDSFGAQLVERCALLHGAEDETAVLALSSLTKSAGGQSGSDFSASGTDTPSAGVAISKLSHHRSGMSWQLDSPWGAAELTTSVIGSYNAINLSLAVTALALLGYDLRRVAHALEPIEAPAGRLQRVHCSAAPGCSVFIDYAHTPDALVSVLVAIRAHCSGRVICVFGCGGDRDRGKRAPMGQAVAQYADVGYLTSDNPRFEDPSEIIADVVAGLPENHALRVQPDRRTAIIDACNEAASDDLVLIAGKGHEDYQDVMGERLPFDDLEVARRALESKAAAEGVA